jgi:uncharacterized protein
MQGKTPATVIDSVEFAHSRQVLHGTVAIASLERLRDVLVSLDGELKFELAGVKDAMGRPALRLRVEGEVQVLCQRCLKAMPHALLSEVLLLLARDEEDLERFSADEDASEAILAEHRLDVLALVEDEAILALPYAPAHPEGQCVMAGREGDREGKPNPFAKLAALKKH